MTVVTVPSAGQFGYIPDAEPQELPPNAWSYAKNMRFKDGYAERFAGSATAFTTPAITPYFLMPFRNLNSKFWIYAGIASVYCDDGTTRTDLTRAAGATPYTGGVDDRWTGGSASGIAILNNGIDLPQFWAGNVANDFANLTAWDANHRAFAMRPFKQYIVALNITKTGVQFPHMVKWSSAAVPGALPTVWDPATATADAGEQDLAETTDTLIDCLPMGDLNVIYKERSMYGMQYIGGTFVWRFFRLPGETGMLARGCVADTPKGHVVLTAGDVIVHSGQGPTSISQGRVRKFLFDRIDTTNYARSFVCVNQLGHEVWICFPESGATVCTQAVVWNWDSDTFGVRELPNATYGASGGIGVTSGATWAASAYTWATHPGTWSSDVLSAAEAQLVVSCSTPTLTVMESGLQFNGVNPTAVLERTGLAFDKPESVKTVSKIIPRIDAAAGTVLTIEVGGSMDAEVQPTYSPPFSYTVGTSYSVDAYATGRFLAFRITSTGQNAWRLKSFDMYIKTHGGY